MDKARLYFKGKKVTILGLGLLGKGLGDAVFAAQCGADVTVTDLKSEQDLAPSVAVLKKYKNVRLVLGGHDVADFENRDLIIKGQGTPLDSEFIAHARKNKIPIRMDDELFVSLLPEKVRVVGVTGTRGKTTVASIIYHVLKKSGKKVHLGGNIRGIATLSLLKKIKSGYIVVLELSSWQLQGFGETKIAPHVSVFTNFLNDHMNYYKNNLKDYFNDKAFIFKYQKENDTLVTGEAVSKKIPKSYKGHLIVAGKSNVPTKWQLPLAGSHNVENIAIAVGALKTLKISIANIQKGIESFKAVEGRLQYVKTFRGIKIYNDNNSTTPEAATVALESFPSQKIVIIMGGADKNLDIKKLAKAVEKYAKAVVWLSGTGTERFQKEGVLSIQNESSKDLQDAVLKAVTIAERGDIVLFSPGFASFGTFVNEYDRNDQFMKIVKDLK